MCRVTDNRMGRKLPQQGDTRAPRGRRERRGGVRRGTRQLDGAFQGGPGGERALPGDQALDQQQRQALQAADGRQRSRRGAQTRRARLLAGPLQPFGHSVEAAGQVAARVHICARRRSLRQADRRLQHQVQALTALLCRLSNRVAGRLRIPRHALGQTCQQTHRRWFVPLWPVGSVGLLRRSTTRVWFAAGKPRAPCFFLLPADSRRACGAGRFTLNLGLAASRPLLLVRGGVRPLGAGRKPGERGGQVDGGCRRFPDEARLAEGEHRQQPVDGRAGGGAAAGGEQVQQRVDCGRLRGVGLSVQCR
ncbi:hypothetical protein DIPPA_21211 [Diplonema papillatum]|nr:hypothetical protein DIPPA_21211 [Diplonema papillatum]